LVFTKIDRVFRSLQDQCNTLAKWESLGVRVIILDMPLQYSDPMGRCTLSVGGAFAQLSSELTGQRIREVNSHLRQTGRPYSNARPYGWLRKDKQYVPCEEERKTARLVQQMRDDGATWSAIALHLCKKEVRKPYRRKGSLGYYSVTEVSLLYRAAICGFPRIAPKVSPADWTAGMQREAVSAGRPPTVVA
jgi:DNA invertase Pin-like site-specific DNA recombinase